MGSATPHPELVKLRLSTVYADGCNEVEAPIPYDTWSSSCTQPYPVRINVKQGSHGRIFRAPASQGQVLTHVGFTPTWGSHCRLYFLDMHKVLEGSIYSAICQCQCQCHLLCLHQMRALCQTPRHADSAVPFAERSSSFRMPVLHSALSTSPYMKKNSENHRGYLLEMRRQPMTDLKVSMRYVSVSGRCSSEQASCLQQQRSSSTHQFQRR